ncbi:lytic murein transglycosylase [Oceanicaulis sp. LC35]|uniref:lytic murein transglycosylase n=1 Tax=Oceanicaulis sp. LC35 TaxID=3349635 RepID=UPI003F84CD48
MMVRTLFKAAVLTATVLVSSAAGAQETSFEDWANGFRTRLADHGAQPATIALMMDGLEPDSRIIERDQSQPEFVRPVWQYLEGAASDARTQNGLSAQATHRDSLERVESQFGVDADILTAVWGLESAYGVIQGDFDIVRSLATLAWEGRRRSFAESQLLAVSEMLERGYADRDQLTGSWAGAMGQTQFIPTTYMRTAVDVEGDGHRDIWSSEIDALGSAANLLRSEGWQTGAPVVTEVALPEGFDFAGWEERDRRAVSAWAMDGVRPVSGEWSPDDLYRPARIVLPAGASGPAFMAFTNFDVIMRYNNSTAYALGVSYLAKRFDGLDALPGGWPEDNPPITRSQSRELQQTLTDLGHDTRGVDGIFGANSRAALKSFQAANGLTPDGYAGRLAYEAVMARAQ